MLRRSDLASLPNDLTAGLILGAVMVPVGLAFGSLAGAPLAGLYAGMLPLIAYALLGTSRQLIIGPDASMAALVAVSVAPLAGGDVGRLTLLAGTLGLLIGVLCLLGGLLRLGFLADFLSKAVIVGYMHGLAVIIAVGQLPKVLGIEADGATTLEQAIDVVRHLGGVSRYEIAIAVFCLVVIFALRRFAPKVPGQVVALAGALCAVVLFDLQAKGVAVVGAIPSGLPRPQLPSLSLDDIRTLLPIALAATVVSFSDTMVTARAFAARNHYRVDANRELLAVGAANAAAAFSQALPISASGARTAVAEAAGARTQVTSVIAALVVGAAILFLTDVLFYLPQAALGAILLAAAWNLCDFGELRRIWRFGGINLVGALIPLAGVVGLGVMEGIIIGVAYSFVLLLRTLAVPSDSVLGRVAADDYHDLALHADAKPVPGVVIYRFSAPLFFMNCSYFRRRVEALVDGGDAKLRGLVIDGSAISEVDLAACDLLQELREELSARGIRLTIGNLRTRVRETLLRGWPAAAADGNLFHSTVGAAVRAAGETP